MRSINTITSLLVVLLGYVLIGCENENADGMNLYEAYKFEVADTLLTASSHEMILSIDAMEDGDVVPDNWELFSISKWDDTFPGDDKWVLLGMVMFNPDLKLGAFDWITMEKVSDNGELKLKINVKQNDTDKYRAMRIIVAVKNGNTYKSAQVVVGQKAKPDTEPFEVKIRYKGQLYVSQAHLDMDEKIVYANPAVEKLMMELSKREGIETIVMDDEVVNFFDVDDVEAQPAIKAMMTAVDASRSFCLRDDIPLGRANDGFNYMASNALGYCALFDDNTFRDSYRDRSLFDYHEVYDEPYLRDAGLNDKVSSLAVAYQGKDPDVCAVLTVWEDSYFNYQDNDRTKHRVSFVASHKVPKLTCHNLKSIPCINSGNSWNDRISSFSFHFGYYGKYLKDY